MGQRYIYLVRHGQMDYTTTQTDILGQGLTVLGQEQARLTGRRLQSLPLTRIYTSSLRRASQTAKQIAAALPSATMKSTRLLWECIPYLPEEFRAWYPNYLVKGRYSRDETMPLNLRPWMNLWPDGTPWELISEGQERAEKAYNRFFRKTRSSELHEAIVSHGNLIRYFICRVLELPLENWTSLDIRNCAISEIMIDDSGRKILISHNDAGHLPNLYKTYQ